MFTSSEESSSIILPKALSISSSASNRRVIRSVSSKDPNTEPSKNSPVVILKRIGIDILKKYGADEQLSFKPDSKSTRKLQKKSQNKNIIKELNGSIESGKDRENKLVAERNQKKLSSKKSVEKWLENVEQSSQEYPLDGDTDENNPKKDGNLKHKMDLHSGRKTKRDKQEKEKNKKQKVSPKDTKRSKVENSRSKKTKTFNDESLTQEQKELLGHKYLQVAVERLSHLTLNKYLKQANVDDNDSTTNSSSIELPSGPSDYSVDSEDSYVESGSDFGKENKAEIRQAMINAPIKKRKENRGRPKKIK